VIFRAIVRVAEFLVLLLVVRLVLRGIGSLFSVSTAPSATARTKSETLQAEDMVKDRICDTFIPRNRAIAARLGGDEEFFCSAACRDKAVAALRRAS